MNENKEFVVHLDEVPWTAGKTGLMRKSLVELPNGPKARVVRIEPGIERLLPWNLTAPL